MKFEPYPTDTITQRQWKSAYVEMLDKRRFTHAITLVWNRSVKLQRARTDLRNLLHRVDRNLLGSRFHKVPTDYRTEAVFFFEGHRHDHVHVHSLWKAPPKMWFELGKMFPRNRGGIWNEVIDSGSYDAVHFSPNGNNAEIVGYVLKEQHRFSEPELTVWSNEFHRSS